MESLEICLEITESKFLSESHDTHHHHAIYYVLARHCTKALHYLA